jgi:hypothetical protein
LITASAMVIVEFKEFMHAEEDERREQRSSQAGDAIGMAFNLKQRGQILKARCQLAGGEAFIRQGLEKLEALGEKVSLDEFQDAMPHNAQLSLGLWDIFFLGSP